MSAAVPATGVVSPRTPERPMAFTPSEFWGGSGAAFLAYQPLGAATFLILSPFSSIFAHAAPTDLGSTIGGYLFIFIVAGIIGLLTSVCAWLAGSPLAYLLGRSLQKVRDERIHLAAFGAYGLAVGLATVIAFLGAFGGSEAFAELGWWIWFALPAAIAVPYGQYRAARHALRADAAAAMTVPAHPHGGKGDR